MSSDDAGAASAHTGTRVNDLADLVWRPVRWVLLAVLLLSFGSVLLRFVPASGSTGALVADIKAGRTHTVLTDLQGMDVTVRWRTGPLTEQSYVYHPADPASDAVSDFATTIRREAGHAADQVRFRDFDATYGAGGITVLIPVAYVALTPWRWLRVAASLAGLVIVLRMLTAREHRCASGPAWTVAGLVTGVGLIGYLWAEPGPGSARSESAPGAAAPRWWRAWLVALGTAAGLGAAGVLVLLACGRL